MILIDQEGTMMHGVISKAYAAKFKPLILEGNVYSITNMRVMPAPPKFRPVENDKIINFSATTNIEEIQDKEDIPKHGFNFSSIEVLSTRVGVDIYLLDVIGIAAYIGPIEESNVIIITSTTVKKNGRYSLSSNSATQVYINLPIPETMDVQNSICSQENNTKEVHIEEGHLKGTMEEQMSYNRKTLQELNDIIFNSSNQGRIFTVEAVIDEVNTRYSWYYISCSKDNCKKQLEKKTDHYYCSKCDRKAEAKPRYKVKLEISDPTASASCVLFDKEAQQLINESAENMVVSSSNESNELPRPIQAICGKMIIFQFRLTDYNFESCRPDYTISKIFLLDDNISSMKIENDDKRNLKKTSKRVVIKKKPKEDIEDADIREDDDDEEEAFKMIRRSKRIERNQRHGVHLDEDEDEESEVQLNSQRSRKKRTHL
ncbi:hypothetical protein ACQ4PT_043448 [Festuca glaucescens]